MRRHGGLWGAREAIAIVGLGLMAAGLAMVSVPLALIVTGALLFLLAVAPVLLGGWEGS